MLHHADSHESETLIRFTFKANDIQLSSIVWLFF